MTARIRSEASPILGLLKARLQTLKARVTDQSVPSFVPNGSLDGFYHVSELEEALEQPIFDIRVHKRADTISTIIQDAPKIFSILLELDYEQGLVPLIENDLLDSSLPIDEARLYEAIPEAAVRFERLQWIYKPYTLRAGAYHKQLRKQQVLPYLSRTKVGGGGFSSIYQVVVHPSHQEKTFIEKQLESAAQGLKAEAELLFLLRSIKHPNIVELLASYTQNGLTSLLFNPADMDLHKLLLNSDRPRAFTHDSAIFQSFQGLAGGLAYLHDFRPRFGSSGNDSGPSLHGYHHDIKPRNILVFGNSLVLADFGLSKLKAKDEDTKTTWKHSTFEYGAPECRDTETLAPGAIGRKSDIWSLACIISEILTYLRFGSEGVKSFRDMRISEREYGTVRCFHDSRDISAAVLEQHASLETETATGSMTSSIKFLRSMFSSLPADRPSADEVERSLAHTSVLALVERLFDIIQGLSNENKAISDLGVFLAQLKLQEMRLRAYCHVLQLKAQDVCPGDILSERLVCDYAEHDIIKSAVTREFPRPSFVDNLFTSLPIIKTTSMSQLDLHV